MYAYTKIFKIVKSIIPKISETELIALRSGGVSIDKDIFSGVICYKKLEKVNRVKDTSMLDETRNILRKYGDQNMYPSNNISHIMSDLGGKGFLGMIIDKKYNGNRMSISSQSDILTMMSSYNPSLSVTTMVPNSLGPGELLQHYGTEQQKNNYLPRLASGKLIPCFGLTGPNNGSDATGSVDIGILKVVNGVKVIEINLNKRYITLAPIADLIGVAFNLKDPENLLKTGKTGVTLALIERSHPGLLIDTYHNPNDAGFPNGTIKGKVQIALDQVIGGESMSGNGWTMLMECLAVGRGVSLPANANGASKAITFGIKHYIQNREQFKMPIGKMEGVREKFLDMFYNTWVIQAAVNHTTHILDEGTTPSVLTAIMKQQTTERSRQVLMNGMDIYAGSAICRGRNNFFTKFYNSSPVGITVEGSNTLTRSLIIFGQGLNKSHPYIYNIFDSIQTNDLPKFRKEFNSMVAFSVRLYASSIMPARKHKRLEHLVQKYANLSNLVALLGGKIKSEQMISGSMADILSNIYLFESVLWYHNNIATEVPSEVKEYCIDRLCSEAEDKLNLVIQNYPNTLIRSLLKPTQCAKVHRNFKHDNVIFDIVVGNTDIDRLLKEHIFYENTVLEDLERLTQLKNGKNKTEYDHLYQDVISVGEIKIEPRPPLSSPTVERPCDL